MSNRSKPYVCLVASSGGHIEELNQLKIIREKYDYFYMFPQTSWTEKLHGKKYFIMDLNRNNKVTKFISMMLMFLQQLIIFIKERPDVVVTTGAAVAIPIGIYANIFKKKLVYIESICRVNTRSKTGDFMYNRADLFIVQWKEQLRCYPNAVYGGWIY